VIKDPDAQARGVIETIFMQFERCATINGVLRYLIRCQLSCPVSDNYLGRLVVAVL
jgi:hypothetical protein